MTRDFKTTAACTDKMPILVSPSSFIREETARRCALSFGQGLRAVVLTGSLARDEETVEEEGDLRRILGDAEFLLIFHEDAKLPGPIAIQRLQRELEQVLESERIRCKIDLSAVRTAFLQRLPKHIFSYELRNNGRVIWGDPTVLSAIPTFDPRDILREDAWRMLSNRLIELLEALVDLDKDRSDPAEQLLYRTVKLYLDMATSFVVFLGAYAPSYREREKQIRLLAEHANSKDTWPFDPLGFSSRLTACTHWKLSPREARAALRGICWQEAIRTAQQLWRWELLQLTGTPHDTPEGELMRRWMKQQPASKRIRGWLYVMRDRGWFRASGNWLRWVRLARQASPRYCAYYAASQLIFQLPGITGDDPAVKRVDDFRSLAAWLPIGCDFRHDGSLNSWQRVASAIVWNYHQFMEKTRA